VVDHDSLFEFECSSESFSAWQGPDIQTHESDPIFIDSFTGARDGAMAMLDRPGIEISICLRMVAGNPRKDCPTGPSGLKRAKDRYKRKD